MSIVKLKHSMIGGECHEQFISGSRADVEHLRKMFVTDAIKPVGKWAASHLNEALKSKPHANAWCLTACIANESYLLGYFESEECIRPEAQSGLTVWLIDFLPRTEGEWGMVPALYLRHLRGELPIQMLCEQYGDLPEDEFLLQVTADSRGMIVWGNQINVLISDAVGITTTEADQLRRAYGHRSPDAVDTLESAVLRGTTTLSVASVIRQLSRDMRAYLGKKPDLELSDFLRRQLLLPVQGEPPANREVRVGIVAVGDLGIDVVAGAAGQFHGLAISAAISSNKNCLDKIAADRRFFVLDRNLPAAVRSLAASLDHCELVIAVGCASDQLFGAVAEAIKDSGMFLCTVALAMLESRQDVPNYRKSLAVLEELSDCIYLLDDVSIDRLVAETPSNSHDVYGIVSDALLAIYRCVGECCTNPGIAGIDMADIWHHVGRTRVLWAGSFSGPVTSIGALLAPAVHDALPDIRDAPSETVVIVSLSEKAGAPSMKMLRAVHESISQCLPIEFHCLLASSGAGSTWNPTTRVSVLIVQSR